MNDPKRLVNIAEEFLNRKPAEYTDEEWFQAATLAYAADMVSPGTNDPVQEYLAWIEWSSLTTKLWRLSLALKLEQELKEEANLP